MLNDGGIKVGNAIVIDGHSDSSNLRVVTHIHSDHIIYLDKSLSIGLKLLATPLTLEWLRELNFIINENDHIALDYNNEVKIDNLKLKLIKAKHIPGSAQVEIEYEGTRLTYTSDFKKPGSETPIIESDVLIMDAIYGRPEYVRDFDDLIEEILADFIKELLTKGPVYVYGYYGKVQEVMELLRGYGVDAPYIVPLKHYKLCRVAERYGLKFGEYILAGTREAEEVMRDEWFIYFAHISNSKVINNRGNHIILSGWEFKYPLRRLNERSWLVAFSDHADFKGLVKYVKESKAKYVIVNRIRSVGAYEFANYINKKIGIKAMVMP